MDSEDEKEAAEDNSRKGNEVEEDLERNSDAGALPSAVIDDDSFEELC